MDQFGRLGHLIRNTRFRLITTRRSRASKYSIPLCSVSFLPGWRKFTLEFAASLSPEVTHVRNQVLYVKNIGCSDMAWQLQPIGIGINLFYYLHRTNLLCRELVVDTHRKMILSQNDPNIVTYLKLHMAMFLVCT